MPKVTVGQENGQDIDINDYDNGIGQHDVLSNGEPLAHR